MKKFLIFGFALFTMSSYAQNRPNDGNNRNVDVLIERSDYYEISSSQKNKIIALKKQASKDFERVGRDRNLSGYEKGRRNREISYNLQRDIDKILNDNQRYKWSNSHRDDYYKDRIDNRLERLEDEYERDIKRIERNYSYDKNLMKRKKEIRKSQYKRDKERLKNVKDYY
ncbi:MULTISPECIES: hypothetical protein [Empedobacter]|uniref:Uncharacterized protein n=1 Tax=Empedobacter falsenii TaxID=343874 RepID=A0A7H9DVL9_9FLAO|nr:MULTISPECIES: hypothetical protein [Empedobacter]QLL59257.1 hypothetical protein FH779_14690 [Empedobacter falsenii]